MAKAQQITGLDVQVPTGKNARMIARVRLEEMYSWSEYVDNPYAVHELHNLRIAAKRLRYTLEIFADVLPDACQTMLKEIEQIQEELGALHDSDVMIALLRLCLGGQDSGQAYEVALAHVEQQKNGKNMFVLPPELVADLLDPDVAPSLKERYGLEDLLLSRQKVREEQYAAFRQHWYTLEARDFRRTLLQLLAE